MRIAIGRKLLIAAAGVAAAGGGAAFAMSAMATATTGPGSVTLPSPTVVAGKAGTKLVFAYQASASAFSGKVSVTVPVGWTPPQTTSATRTGYVAVGKGTCTSVAKPTVTGTGPWVVTTTASCPASASFPFFYGPIVAPARAGASTFPVAAASGKATPLRLATQPVVTVAPNTASSLVIRDAPSTAVAGVPGSFIVTAYDAFGNVATGYTGTVAISSTDTRAIVPAPYTFTAADRGVHAFSISWLTAATENIAVKDTVTASLATTKSSVVVSPAPASAIAVAPTSGGTVAGTTRTFSAAVSDAYGNRVTNYAGTVQLASTDPQAVLPAAYTFTGRGTGRDNGVHTFSLALRTAGTQTVTVADAAAPAVTGTSPALTVTSAPPTALRATVPASMTAGVPAVVTVTAVDPYGNRAADARTSIHVSSSDATATLPADFTLTAADAGARSVGPTLRTAGAPSISFADKAGKLTAAVEPVPVAPGALARLTLAAPSGPAVAGVPVRFTALGSDLYGNPLDDSTSSATFSVAPDGSCSAADCTITVADTGSGRHTVTASLGTVTGSTTIAVTPAAVDRVVVSGPSSLVAGAAKGYTAAGVDSYGNGTGDLTPTASFTIAPDGTCSGASCSATAADPAGSAHTVAAVVDGIVGSAPVTVVPAAAHHIAVTASAASVVVGNPVGLGVRTFDVYGNDRGDATPDATFSVSPDGSCSGAACTITVADTGAGTHTITGQVGALTSQVSVAATKGLLARLVVTRSGTLPVLPGIATSYTVTGFDAQGNDLGDQTAEATFSILPDGSCTGPVCVAALADATSSAHVVTATVYGVSGSTADPVDPDGRFHVVGTKIIGPDGRPFTVRGMNRSAFTYSPTGWYESWNNYLQMRGWGANAVRITLSPHFWLPSMCTYDPRYVAAIDQAVTWAETLQMLVILDDHWSTQNRTCGTNFAGQQKMADDTSVIFLTQLVNRYKNHPYVAFDLYNEPHDITDDVWRNGGTVDGWHAVGMQTLLETVRAAGATNLVFASGNDWANDVSLVLDRPLANDKDVVYAIHSYPIFCNGPVSNLVPFLCEGKVVPPFLDNLDAPVILRRAVVMTEFGTQRSTATDNTNSIAWAEAHGIGWMAWVWGAGSPADYNIVADWTTFAPNVAGKPIRDAMWAARGWTTPFGK